MVNPGPDEPSRGTEYPSLEKSPASGDAHEPVDYPSDSAATPAYPPPPSGWQQPGYQQPGYQQPGYGPPEYQPPAYQQPDYQQGGYPPPPTGYPPQFPGPQPYGFNPYGDPSANQYANPYAPARPIGTNGKAIAALVTSLVGLTLCGLPSFVGVILGIIAMRETKRTGQEGYGLALAGVIIGSVVTVFAVIFVIIYVIGIAAAISSPDYY